MKIDIGENIVEPIIRDQVAAAIAAHLGDPEDMMKKLVSAALKTKVNDKGVVSQYHHENKYDFLEALCAKAIREAAFKALEKVVADQLPNIQKSIENELKKRPQKTAAAIIAGFCDNTELARYRTTVSFNFDTRD